MKTVLLACRDPAVADAWRVELQATGQWKVLGPVTSFAVARVTMHRHNPDLMVADMHLVDGSVIDMIRVLRTGTAPLRAQILVVARGQDDPLLLDALQEGADNFFDAAGDARALARHALETINGGAHIAPWIARRLLDHFGPSAKGESRPHVEQLIAPLELTAPERELLRQLAIDGRVAGAGGPRDVAARVRAIYRKMQWSLRAGDLQLQTAA